MLGPNNTDAVPRSEILAMGLSESKVLRLIQLMEAPVSYSAFIFTLLQVIGKTVPVAGPTAIVQVSTKCVLVLFTSV